MDKDLWTRFGRMDWKSQRDAVLSVLPDVLAGLGEEPATTKEMIAKVGEALGLKLDQMPRYANLVSQRLMGLAKRGYPHATHDGEERELYGKVVRPWRWWREAKSTAPMQEDAVSRTSALEDRVKALEARVDELEVEAAFRGEKWTEMLDAIDARLDRLEAPAASRMAAVL